MKGMKKPLALLLALVMAFGLMNVGAWADDEEPVPVEEASAGDIVEEAQEAPVVGTPIPARPDVELPDEEEVAEDADWDDEAVLLDGDDVVEFTPESGLTANQTSFPSALSSGVYKLLADVTVSGGVAIPAGVTATLDLNGHSYTGSGAFTLGGEFTITDTSESPGTVNISSSYAFSFSGSSNLTIDGGVTISGANGAYITTRNNTIALENGTVTFSGYGFWTGCGAKGDKTADNNVITIGKDGVIEARSYGVGLWGTKNTLEVSGKIHANSLPVFTNGQPNDGSLSHWSEDITIKVHEGAEIISTDSDSLAIYLPGTGDCIIDGGYIRGPVAVYLKSARLKISGGELVGTGPHVDWVHNNNGSSDGGSALMVEKAKDYRPDEFVVEVTGGTFTSQNSNAVASYSYGGQVDPSKFITGGAFKGPVAMDSALVAEGYTLAASGNVVPNESGTKTPDYVVEWTKADNSKVYLATFPTELTGGTYKLLADVTVESTEINDADADVILDLGAYDLTYTGQRGLYVKAAKSVTVNGTGALKISGQAVYVEADGTVIDFNAKIDSGDRGVNLRAASKNVNFTLGKDAEIKATVNGITAFGTSNTVNVYGKIATHTSFALCTNGQKNTGSNTNWSDEIVFNIGDGADITSDTIAVYLPGGGAFNMTGGSITGATGIYNKCAKLNISDGTVTGNGGREEYQFYNNGCYNTGDAVAIDNCAYPHGKPVVSITGGTFKSEKGSAIGSYFYAEKESEPIKGFIAGKTESGENNPATFTGVLPVNADCVESGYRIDGDGKVVASAFKVTDTKTGDEDNSVTYTVQKTGESDTFTVKAQSEADEEPITESTQVAKQITNLAATVDMAGLLSEQETAPTSDTTVTFEMTAEEKSAGTMSDGNKKTTFEIHPEYKVGNEDAQPLDNKFIKQPIPICFPAFRAAEGKTVTAVWHIINSDKGLKESVDFTYNESGLSFSLSSFSDLEVWEGDKDPTGEPIYDYTLTLEEAVTHYDVDGDNFKEYKIDDEIAYDIILKSNGYKDVAISDVNFSLNTDGLTVKSITIKDANDVEFDDSEKASSTTNQMKYAFSNNNTSAGDLVVNSSGTTIGQVVFTFPDATRNHGYTVSIGDTSVKARKLGTAQDVAQSNQVKVETDPEYKIHVYNPEHIAAGDTTETARAEIGTGYTYTILTGYNGDKALPVPSIGDGYKFLGYKVTKVNADPPWVQGNWTITDAVNSAVNPCTNPDADTKYVDYAYEVDTTDELKALLNQHGMWGDVELEAVYEVQLYTLNIQKPPAKNTPDNGVINQATDATFDAYSVSYKYDINGVVYDSNGKVLTKTDTSTSPASETTLTNIPEVTRNYYDFDNFVAYAASATGAGNWAQYEAVALKDGETAKAFPKGKWGDITLNATYKATVYTITLKNPDVDANQVIKTGNEATDVAIAFEKNSASSGAVNYTVEGFTSGYAYNYTGTKTEAVIPYDPFLKHYDFANAYAVINGTGTGWTTGADENVGESEKIGEGKYGDVELRAKYTPHKYTATYTPDATEIVGEAITFTAIDGTEITYASNKFTYTIEDGVNADTEAIFGTPTRPGYTFSGWTITEKQAFYNNAKDPSGYTGTLTGAEAKDKDYGGWTWDVPVNPDSPTDDSSTPDKTPEKVWGDVTLKANWTLNGVLKTFAYKYARNGDLLALFAIKAGSVTGTYTYTAGKATTTNKAEDMFVVSNQYKALFTDAELETLALGESDDVVIYGYIGAGTNTATDSKPLAVIAYANDGNGSTNNEKIAYAGDMTGDSKTNAGDYGNVNAMLANPNQYQYSQVSVKSRLAADVYGKGAEKDGWFGGISDVKFIMNATVGITGDNNPDKAA